jgi:hypothetical protein
VRVICRSISITQKCPQTLPPSIFAGGVSRDETRLCAAREECSPQVCSIRYNQFLVCKMEMSYTVTLTCLLHRLMLGPETQGRMTYVEISQKRMRRALEQQR